MPKISIRVVCINGKHPWRMCQGDNLRTNVRATNGQKIHMGCLPFIVPFSITWKTRKFQLENQMVHIIPFGVLLKVMYVYYSFWDLQLMFIHFACYPFSVKTS